MREKGFTLVELLAVIVIIGILSVLVVPNVVKTLRSSKENMFITSTQSLYKVMQNYIIKEQLKDPLTEVTGSFSNYCSGFDELEGYKTNNNYYVEISNGKISKIAINNDDFIIDTIDSNTKIENIDKSKLRDYTADDDICSGGSSCSINSSKLYCKISNNNTVYADNVSSTYVTSATGINFASKSTITNGQGLYTNNKLEDGKNMYFRGGSFCAYTNYLNSDGSMCTAAGGTWDGNTCSYDLDRAACQANGFTYYDLKNNVTFAEHNWKIIRIDENGNIRMILADTTTGSTIYNGPLSDAAYVGYMYGIKPSTTYEEAHVNTNNSAIKTYSENWYNANLLSYSSYIADAGYCNDRSISSGLGYGGNSTYFGPYARNDSNSSSSPRFACPNSSNDLFTTASSTFGNKASTYPIGLLTADEARYGGLQQGKSYSSDYNYTNYLKMSSIYWIMSPISSSTYGPSMYTVRNTGTLYGSSVYEWVNNTYSFRPTIALKPSVSITTGTGTYDNPYVIE